MATERDKKAGGIHVATLLTLGPEAMDVYRSFDWGSEAEKHDISQAKEKFARYFTPRTSGTSFCREIRNLVRLSMHF